MKKNTLGWSGIALLIIILAAIFVRVYKFDTYLYFKMDQSRDSLMISNAVVNGPQYLPLLGARVGAVKLKHGFLRLGPIYYYFQYLSGVIFHSTEPYVYAYPDLMFSILAIPLLYLLLRLYFSKKNSLLITAMYALSFIVIQYSRFAWNPNSLQFFELLCFYGLLKFLNEPSENDKHKKWWLIAWATGMIVGSQLHFFGFFSLVGISGLMIIFHCDLWRKEVLLSYKKKDALKPFWRWAGVVVVVFLIFYTPVIISDVFKGGQNTTNFFEALVAKPVSKPITDKIAKDATENLKYYCLITTSECYGSSMKKEYPAIFLTALILLLGFVAVARKLRQKNLTSMQRDFLMLLIFWVAVYTILTVPVSFQLRPRFFIVVFAIPFILLGLVFEYMDEKFKKDYAIALSLLMTVGIISWNAYGTNEWFKEQASSQKKSLIVKRTLILKAKDGVTLGELQGVTDWMYAHHTTGSTLYFYTKPEHIRPLTFLLYEKHDPGLVSASMVINNDPNAQYFAVTPAKNGIQPVLTKYPKNDVTVIAKQQFGQLLVSEIAVNNRSVSPLFRFNKSAKKTDRVFWKDVFGIKDDKSNKNLIQIDGAE